MHHLLEHINQDITRRLSKDKDSAVNKTEYDSKKIQQVNPGKQIILFETLPKCSHELTCQKRYKYIDQMTFSILIFHESHYFILMYVFFLNFHLSVIATYMLL